MIMKRVGVGHFDSNAPMCHHRSAERVHGAQGHGQRGGVHGAGVRARGRAEEPLPGRGPGRRHGPDRVARPQGLPDAARLAELARGGRGAVHRGDELCGPRERGLAARESADEHSVLEYRLAEWRLAQDCARSDHGRVARYKDEVKLFVDMFNGLFVVFFG